LTHDLVRFAVRLAPFALALSCATCSSPAEEKSWTIPAGQDVTLTDTASDGTERILRVPAGTFGASMDGAIEASDPDAVLDVAAFVARTGNEPLSYPVVAKFSALQVAAGDGPMTLRMELSESQIQAVSDAGRTIVGRYRVDGNRIGAEPSSGQGDWELALGAVRKDADTGKVFLDVPVYATAERMTFVAASSPGFKLYGLPAKTMGAGGSAPSDGTPPLTRPWVAVCESGMDPATDPRLAKVYTMVSESSSWLAGKGYAKAGLSSKEYWEIESLAQIDASAVLGGTNTASDGTRYNVVLITNQVFCGESVASAAGCYYGETRAIELLPTVAELPLAGMNGMGDAAAHELVHAVQLAEAPTLFTRVGPDGKADPRRHWITEGTASAMGFWRLAGEDPALFMASRYHGGWRLWETFHELASSTGLDAYRVWEYYGLLGNGDLGYVHSLLTNIEASGPTGSTYAVMDRALRATMGEALKNEVAALAAESSNGSLQESIEASSTLGLSLIKTAIHRSPTMGYPHCSEEFVIDIPAEASPKRATFSWLAAPMSMTCIRVRSVDHLDRHGESCIKLTVEGTTPTGAQVMVPSGATVLNSAQRKQPFAYDWDTLWIHGDQAYLYLVNIDMNGAAADDSGTNLAGQTVTAEIDPTCGVAPDPFQVECYETKVVCTEKGCGLYMKSPEPDGCWVEIASCDGAGNCYQNKRNEDVPLDGFGVCAGTSELMHDVQPEGAPAVGYDDAKLPESGRCGELNACRRIILCAK